MILRCPHCGVSSDYPSPTHITREDVSALIEAKDATFAGGFVHALLEAYRRADPHNRAALAMGFDWLPELAEATAR